MAVSRFAEECDVGGDGTEKTGSKGQGAVSDDVICGAMLMF